MLQAEREAMRLGLHHPLDRNGKRIDKYRSSEALDAALQRYRDAVKVANDAAKARLQELACALQPHLVHLSLACSFAVVATALEAHVRHAGQHWVLPSVGLPPALAGAAAGDGELSSGTAGEGDATAAAGLHMQGFWPYWMDPRMTTTVRNSLRLDSMALLTGPNMAGEVACAMTTYASVAVLTKCIADEKQLCRQCGKSFRCTCWCTPGKSTVLRSICAVALLANCGLMVPAECASVPFLDAFMLRNFSGDSPAESKSAYAMECDEIR